MPLNSPIQRVPRTQSDESRVIEQAVRDAAVSSVLPPVEDSYPSSTLQTPTGPSADQQYGRIDYGSNLHLGFFGGGSSWGFVPEEIRDIPEELDHQVNTLDGVPDIQQGSLHIPGSMTDIQRNDTLESIPMIDPVEGVGPEVTGVDAGSRVEALQTMMQEQRATDFCVNNRVRIAKETRGRINPEPRFFCNICKVHCSREADLQRHKQSKHGMANVMYICTASGCNFSNCRKDKMSGHEQNTGHSCSVINISQAGATGSNISGTGEEAS